MGKKWKWLAKIFAFFGMCVGLFGIGTFTQVNGIASAVKDFFDPIFGKLLFAQGLPVTISSGAMSVPEAKYYFRNPDKIINHIVKFKHLTHGVKDLPRFGSYLSHRLPEDM